MAKYIASKGVAVKEFFKLLQKYLLGVEVKQLCGIISEINENRMKTKDSDPYDFFTSVSRFVR